MGRRTLTGWAFGAVVFLLACAPPWVGLYGPKGVGDMYLFRLYGHRMEIYHRWPYHDFFFDWAPGLVPPVLFPTWLPGDYYHAFHVLDALYAVLALGAVAWTLVLLGAGTRRLFLGVGAAAVAPFALGSISIDSLDYWPALFTAAGLAVFLSGRYRIAAGLLGFAIVAKVYALVLAPILLVWLWRRRGRDEAVRCTAIGTAVVVLVSLPFLIVGPTGLGFSIKSQFVRGLQMESLGASILMALDHLGLYHARVVVGTPYSLDIAGGLARAVGVLFTLVTVAVLLWIYLRYFRGPDERQRLVTACAAALTAYVAFSRVLSPQYILWLVLVIPLLTGAAGLAAEALLLAACAVTMTWFPGRFVHLQHISPVSWFVLARNVLLVLAFAATARPLLRRHEAPAGSAEQIRHEQVPQG